MMVFRRIFQRPRTRITLLFSAVLVLLCFVIVMYPMSTSLLQKTFETHAIVVESRRSEYYILNRNFFEFLSRTSMECFIQVEPDEEWSAEAVVKTKLIDNDASQDAESEQTTGADSANTRFTSPTHVGESPTKYILAYRHFEQLGKTTENLLQLAAVSKTWGRFVVEPGVRNSRFLLKPGLSGTYPFRYLL